MILLSNAYNLNKNVIYTNNTNVSTNRQLQIIYFWGERHILSNAYYVILIKNTSISIPHFYYLEIFMNFIINISLKFVFFLLKKFSSSLISFVLITKKKLA